MKKTSPTFPHKNGAALVLILGFLAILTLIIMAFSTQSRSERLAMRDFLSKAQNRHLLHAAMTRALEDIDKLGAPYSNTLAHVSENYGSNSTYMIDSIDFGAFSDHIPGKGSPVREALDLQYRTARWQTVHDATGKPVGRVGYAILNTSGLLDANYAGKTKGSKYTTRYRGLTPQELQLSSELLPELSANADYIGRRLGPEGDMQTQTLLAEPETLSAGLAMVYNRDKAWRRFESLRDFNVLNRRDEIIELNAENFRPYSYFIPSTNTPPAFMGNTMNNLDEDAIKKALTEIGIVDMENQNLVLAQLNDYIDKDTKPNDAKYSSEVAPLINEILLNCVYGIYYTEDIVDTDETNETGYIEETNQVIDIYTEYELFAELWFPFAHGSTVDSFTLSIDSAFNQPAFSNSLSNVTVAVDTSTWGESTIDFDLIWGTRTNIAYGSFTLPSDEEYSYTNAYDETNGLIVATNESIFIDFSLLNNTLKVDSDEAQNIELSFNKAGERIQEIIDLLLASNGIPEDAVSMNLVASNSNISVTNNEILYTYKIGASTIDPRLNWDGGNLNHWVPSGEAGDFEATLLGINEGPIRDLGNANLPEGATAHQIYIRNSGKIDSPYEFTYLLFDENRPWHTFQFFKDLDQDENGNDLKTRQIAHKLTSSTNETPRSGWINANSTISNVVASAFFLQPQDTFIGQPAPKLPPLTAPQAGKLADELIFNGPYNHPTNISEQLSYESVITITGNSNAWDAESVLRNSLSLFKFNDSTFTVLLAAQKGTDLNEDGFISDGEVQSTQKAVADIWRNPKNGETACTFYGLESTLKSSIGTGRSWESLLEAFRPQE